MDKISKVAIKYTGKSEKSAKRQCTEALIQFAIDNKLSQYQTLLLLEQHGLLSMRQQSQLTSLAISQFKESDIEHIKSAMRNYLDEHKVVSG